jgi:glucosamine--fructose-6-phosphate aminotransferase (isomerizing)
MANETLMAREIAQAGEAVATQLASNKTALVDIAARLRARSPRVVVTIGRGSSDHAALYLKYLIEICLGLPCASIGPSIASVYRSPLRLDGQVAITISQSGRSPDIIALQRAAKTAGALTIALVNDEESPVAREADQCLPLGAGVERSVAATKSMIAALVAGASLTAHWQANADLLAAIADLPSLFARLTDPPEESVAQIAATRSGLVLGRGATLAIAAEAALKLKETSAIHAEAFSADRDDPRALGAARRALPHL